MTQLNANDRDVCACPPAGVLACCLLLVLHTCAPAFSSSFRGDSLAALELAGDSSWERGVSLDQAWSLASGLVLTSRYVRDPGDGPASRQRGLTSSESGHALSLDLGQSRTLTASLSQRREEWDPWLGRQGAGNSRSSLEFKSDLGADGMGAVRLALQSTASAEGSRRSREASREASLTLSPAPGLRLTADHSMQDGSGGSSRQSQSLGAALNLAPDAELRATTKRLSSDGGEDKQEMALALNAKVAGGDLRAEHSQAEGSAGSFDSRRYSFAGALGGGAHKTSLKASFREKRGDEAEAPLLRTSELRLDQPLAPGLVLGVSRRSKVAGTNASPEASAETACRLTARMWSGGELRADWAEEQVGEQERGRHLVALSHDWGSLKARAEERAWSTGDDQSSERTVAIETTTGELPEWARGISTAHQFQDAQEYLAGRPLAWSGADMSAAGYRLWASERSGPDGGGDSGGFAHRRLIGDRVSLQLTGELRPLGAAGGDDGRPLPVRREMVDVGVKLGGGLSARCGVGLQTGLDPPHDQLSRLRLGVWGALGEGEQVEGEVWRESGRWEGASADRTSVSVLYSRRASEEDQVHLKLGYAWGTGLADESSRDCRLTFGYGKPF